MTDAKSCDPVPSDKQEAVYRFRDAISDLTAAYVVCYTEDAPWNDHPVPAESDELVDKKRIQSAMRIYIQALPEKERLVIDQYFYKDRRLVDIAQDMNVTGSWVSKLLSSGLRRLQAMTEHLEEQQKI
jgi:RNA polymerase sigma factor for flagellar operon FliA